LTGLEKQKIILGSPWLEETMNHAQHPFDDNELSILISLLNSLEPEVIWIDARMNIAMELAAEENDSNEKEGIPMKNWY
jgi:hypothetical protein